MTESKKILMVYNADSGLLNSIKDGIEKITSPTTYQCRLCGLTYGFATMKDVWRRFLEDLPLPVEFLHRDEFHEQYGDKYGLPAIFILEEGTLESLISSEEMNTLETLNELMKMVTEKLREAGID